MTHCWRTAARARRRGGRTAAEFAISDGRAVAGVARGRVRRGAGGRAPHAGRRAAVSRSLSSAGRRRVARARRRARRIRPVHRAVGGEDALLRATAITLEHRSLLIIERLTGDADTRPILQKAREQMLATEQLTRQAAAVHAPAAAIGRVADELAAAESGACPPRARGRPERGQHAAACRRRVLAQAAVQGTAIFFQWRTTMTRIPRIMLIRRLILAATFALAFAPLLMSAQAPAPVAARASATPSTVTPKPITLDDYARFKRIAGAAISADGKWTLYTVTPNDGDGTLFVKALDAATVYEVPRGTGASFSDNARWVGYFITPPAAGRGGRGAGGRGGGGAPAQGEGGGSRAGAHVRAARSDQRIEVDVPSRRQLRVLTRWRVAVDAASGRHRRTGGRRRRGRGGRGANAAPAAEAATAGTDLLMRHLATGAQRYVGNVGSYAFDDAGKLMAYTVRGQQRLGNGVYVMTLSSGEQRMLDARVGRLRPVDVERGRHEPRGAERRQGARQASEGQHRDRLARRRNAGDADGDAGSRQGVGVSGRHGDQRVHAAAMEPRRRARTGRHQGTGTRASRDHRTTGERGRVALEGHRAAIGADRPAESGSARDVCRGHRSATR